MKKSAGEHGVRIVFFGNEQLVQGIEEQKTPIFDGLLAAGYDIAALVLPRRKEQISRKKKTLRIIEAAEKAGVPVIYAEEEANFDQRLTELNAEVGVLAAFGKIVKQSTIDLFPFGIVNVHPSLLPKYRGSSPIESAIVNLDSQTGVSIMKLTKEMDAGAVYAQKSFALNGTETKFDLAQKCGELGAEIMLEVLPKVLSGEKKGGEQAEKKATYCKLLEKSDGILQPEEENAREIDAKVRAYLGFPRTRLEYKGVEIILTETKLLDFDPGDSWPDILKCRDNTALQIVEIISPKSGRLMKFKDYLNGLN